MATWNDFFYTTNTNNYQTPEWMSFNDGAAGAQVIHAGTEAAQVIRCPHPGFPPPTGPSNLPPIKSVELKMRICCERCEERVVSRLIHVEGVQGVKCNQLQQKVTVTGTAPREEILKACKKLFKGSTWYPS